jgi:gluconolactonase
MIALAALVQADFRAIVPANSPLEEGATGFKFTEGAAWLRDGSLIWSDIPADTIYRLNRGNLSVFRKPSQNANGNVVDAKGQVVTCEHATRRVTRTGRDGKVTVLADRYQGKRLNSPNDAVAHSNGTVYFTDPPYGIRPEQEELGFAGVYAARPNQPLRLIGRDFRKPNGIALSPDERTLYVSDTEAGHIRSFSVGPDGNVIGSPRTIFAEVKGTKPGVPDGLRVDTKGNVYSTGPGGIHVFDPSGRALGVIAVPQVTTNCAWGGSDARTLFITAGSSIYRIRLNVPGKRW